MRSGTAIPIPSLLLAVALLVTAGAARGQTIITGSGTISANVTDGVEASGSPGDTLVIDGDVFVLNNRPDTDGAVVMQTSGYEVTNGGTITGATFSGQDAVFFETGDGILVNNGTLKGGAASVGSADVTGTLTFTNNGTIEADLLALDAQGRADVVNAGTVGGTLQLFAGGTVINQAGARIDTIGTGIRGDSTADVPIEITNAGFIESSGAGAVRLTGPGGMILTNESGGEILGTGTSSAGVAVAADSGSGLVSLFNQGTISSEGGSAVDIVGGDVVQVTNEGTLTSTSTTAPVVSLNSDLGTLNAVFTNSGSIVAAAGSSAPAVRMGAANDMVTLQTGSSINGDIDGGSGPTDKVELQGSGSFAHGFLHFYELTMNGASWTLSGESEIAHVEVITGKLTLDAPGKGLEVIVGPLTVHEDAELENRGLVSTFGGIQFGDLDDEFLNSGMVRLVDMASTETALNMGGGDDRVILDSGAVEGDIAGGTGTDTLILRGAGSFGTTGEALREMEILQVEASRWTLGGAIDGLTTVDVNTGILDLADGTSLAGAVSVEAGGVLASADGGAVDLLGSLVNRGEVAPGGIFGVIRVAGDYDQDSAAALSVSVGSGGEGKAERNLVVAGAASLAGELVVIPIGFAGTPVNQEIVEVGGTRTGRFDPDPTVSPLLAALVCYDDDLQCPTPPISGVAPAPVPGAGIVSVQLVKTKTFAEVASTPNQLAVAQAVDAVQAAGVQDPALDSLFDLTDQAALDAGFDQLSPEPLGASAQLAFENARWYTSSLSDHLREMRLGIRVAGQGAASGVQLASLGSGAGSVFRFAPALPAQAAAAPDLTARKLGVWQPRASGYAVLSDLGSGSSNTGYDAVTGVLGLGTEQWTRRNLLLGAELSAAYTRLTSDRDGTDFDAVSGRFAVYGSYDRSPWYLDVVTSYAYHWYDATRRIRYGSVEPVDLTADSEHGAHEVSSYLGTGFSFDYAGWDFGPEASVQYTALFEEGYDEKSASEVALDVAKRTQDSLSSRVGVRLSRPWQIDEQNRIEPSLSVAWAREWLDTSQNMEATFQVSPVGRFEVASRDLSRDAVVARLGLRAAVSETMLVDVGYGVDAGRSGYLSQQVGVAFSGRF